MPENKNFEGGGGGETEPTREELIIEELKDETLGDDKKRKKVVELCKMYETDDEEKNTRILDRAEYLLTALERFDNGPGKITGRVGKLPSLKRIRDRIIDDFHQELASL